MPPCLSFHCVLLAVYVTCAVSAIRPDDPPNRGVALSVEYLIPVLCSEVCVGGDSGGSVEQKENVMCRTPRSAMERDDEDYF